VDIFERPPGFQPSPKTITGAIPILGYFYF
jgi:hypothetical protein